LAIEVGTALDFFAGIGLAQMGLELGGWRVTLSNDISVKKYQMYKHHWGEDRHYILEDVFNLDPSGIPNAELAWASFPCVDLSLAGNRQGLNGNSSGAFWGFHRLISSKALEHRPYLVVLENVIGMLTSHQGEDLETVIASVNQLGYKTDLIAVDAAHFVPQSRPRLFIIGARGPYQLSDTPPAPSPIRPPAVLSFIRSHSALNWGMTAPVSLPKRQQSFADIVEWFPADADIWWAEEAVQKLLCQMSPRHLKAVTELSLGDSVSFGTVYRRIRPSGYKAEVRLDGLAGCLRTPVGGSSKQFVIQMGRGRIAARNMTAIEYARLQGAAEYRIGVPYNQALHGFGDAVCVPVVAWIANNLLGNLRRPITGQKAVLVHA
jgi:DNA (cytosine-5)-methyltransferase 1